MTCTKVKSGSGKHQRTITKCTTKLVSGPVTFTAKLARAKLARDGVVYATGTEQAGRLVLNARRPVPRGRYTLILRFRQGRWRVTMRRHIRID